VNELIALVGFSFASSATPGPNNVLLWASGAQFGFRRTLRHVVGTAVGIGAMALATAAGLGVLFEAIPGLSFAMKLAGSAYLLFLAYQVAGAGAVSRGQVSHPLGLFQAAAFQALNPKAWIFALGAVTTFRPPDLPLVVGSILVAATMMTVVVPSAALWAGAGGALGRLVEGERAQRIVSIGLAILLVASVATVWV
jgi:threonine/homoserine/homoserine lactone efflux protein